MTEDQFEELRLLLERLVVALEAIARRLGEPPRPPQEEPRHTP